MKHNNIKNLFIAGLTLLSFGFLSAQFPIPSGIDNALQVIQRVLVTTNGMFSGSVVMDTNTGANNIYINPSYLPISQAYSGQYVLTVNSSGYVSFTTWASTISGATISGNNLIVTLTDWSILDLGSVVWPQGPQGSQWPQGLQGLSWSQGIQGIQWPAGPAGPQGIWILNIVDNGSGSVTINLTDGTSSVINVSGGGNSPWEFGAGSPQSAQIMSAGNNAAGSYSVVWWANNAANNLSDYGFIGWWEYNVLSWGTHASIAGWYMNTGQDSWYGFIGAWWTNILSNSFSSSIVGGRENYIYSGSYHSILWWRSNSIFELWLANVIAWWVGNSITWHISFIGGGNRNRIFWQRSFVWWGDWNSITWSSRSFIGWGWDNRIISNNWNWNGIVIAGWFNNQISWWSYSSIGGWLYNHIVWFGVIAWWSYNRTHAGISTIWWWFGNNIYSTWSTIAWWQSNQITWENSFIWWGYFNIINSSSILSNQWHHVIAWWRLNQIIQAQQFSSILWGENNIISWSFSSIAWWWGNHIYGASSFIWGGNSNQILSDSSAIIWWLSNTISWNLWLSFWKNNNISWSNSVALWTFAQAFHDHSFVWNSTGVASYFRTLKPGTFIINSYNGVGINTNDPFHTLDINGDVRIQNISTWDGLDYILVENNGIVKKVAPAWFLSTNTLQEAKITLTPSEIYTLHTTPIQLIAAPSASAYIDVISTSVVIEAWTTTYTGLGNVYIDIQYGLASLGFPGNGILETEWDVSGLNWWQQTTGLKSWRSSNNQSRFELWTGIYIKNSDAVSDGDGVLHISIVYRIVEL
jgi:hypothetical protein